MNHSHLKWLPIKDVRRGFTLVELLVVMGIISILVGLLAPSISQARKRAQSIACVNNLKQLGTALQLYWNDNDGAISGLSNKFPAWDDPVFKPWGALLLPYIGSDAVFQDPGRPKTIPYTDIPIHYYLNLLPGYRSLLDPDSPDGTFVLDSKQIVNPSAFILITDELYQSPPAQGPDYDPTNETSDRTGFSDDADCLPPYHPGGANFLFADGHVAVYHNYDESTMTYWYDTMGNWEPAAPSP